MKRNMVKLVALYPEFTDLEQTEEFVKVSYFLDIAVDTLSNDEIIRMMDDMDSIDELIYEDEAGVHLQIDLPSFVYEDGYLDALMETA